MLFRPFAAAGLLLSASMGVALAAPVPMIDAPMAAMPASPLVQAFVQDAATGNQFEMTEAQIALEKSTDPAVRSFAQRTLNDHHQAELALEHAAPAGVYTHFMFDQAHQAKIDALQDLSGAAFDQAYWTDQQEAHAAAANALAVYAASGEDPALRAWARETLPVVRDHQRMLASLTGQGPLAMQ